jgi:hypothetical protein
VIWRLKTEKLSQEKKYEEILLEFIITWILLTHDVELFEVCVKNYLKFGMQKILYQRRSV